MPAAKRFIDKTSPSCNRRGYLIRFIMHIMMMCRPWLAIAYLKMALEMFNSVPATDTITDTVGNQESGASLQVVDNIGNRHAIGCRAR